MYSFIIIIFLAKKKTLGKLSLESFNPFAKSLLRALNFDAAEKISGPCSMTEGYFFPVC